MKLNIHELDDETIVSVDGHEAWLDPIYDAYHVAGDQRPCLTGDVTVRRLDQRLFQVVGSIEFIPRVDCSRCEILLSWPIKADFSVYYQDAPDQIRGKADIKLRKAELDHYYFENNTIDLTSLLVDAIELEIPMTVERLSPDGKKCLECLQDRQGGVVYDDIKGREDANPFSILRNLKLSKD